MDLKESVLISMNESFDLGGNDIFRYEDRLCVPDIDDLRTKIVVEAPGSRYLIHPGSSNMNHDLKNIYRWDGIKNDIAEYVAKCSNCQQVKAEHVKPYGHTQMIEVSTRKWEPIKMDFVVCLPRTRSHHDSIWVIMDEMTNSDHFIPVKST